MNVQAKKLIFRSREEHQRAGVMERGLDTNVKRTRHLIFKTIAEIAYHSGDLTRNIEELPYKLCNTETSKDYADIYREREVIRERLRLALGMKLRPQDKPVAVSSGVEESNIDEKYYESNLSVKEIMREMKKLKITLIGNKWVVENKIKSVREVAGKIGFDIPKYLPDKAIST